jgi:tetratricopeptide (TPR) repeat protein
MGKTGRNDERRRAGSRLKTAVISFLALEVLFGLQPASGGENQPVPGRKYDFLILELLGRQKSFGDPAAARQTLDDLFAQIQKKAAPRARYDKAEAIQVLKTIGRVLEEEGNFVYRKNNLLIEGLKKRSDGKRFIDCDDYSALYLLLGERLGLPLRPVYAPNHVFLVCSPEDAPSFYWESTLGEEKDAGFYRSWLNIREDSGYPKILNEKEFDAIQLCNLGVAWYERRDYEKAVYFYREAIELNPGYAVAFNNLGVAYAKKDQFQKALENYEKASGLEAHYPAPFFNMGVAYYRLGNMKRAAEHFKKAFLEDPGFGSAEQVEILAVMEKGESDRVFDLIAKIYQPK